jgi:hypothetical protein
MNSPFPGMNPYLESENLWPTFHQNIVNCLYQMLLPNLVDRYRSRIVLREYQTEEPLFTSILRIDHREYFLEIRNRNDDKLVTVVDLASPTNRTTGTGRQKILECRQQAGPQRVNLVLIDVVLSGRSVLDLPKEGQPAYDYNVSVTRAVQPDRMEIYTGMLEKRLPRFKIPLAADDRDTIVDLQTIFQRAYELGQFASKIEYEKDPKVPLAEERREWLDQLLRTEKVRLS